MKRKFNPRWSRELNLRENEYEIQSDFKLILSLLKELLFYIIMLIPNLAAMLLYLIIGRTDKAGEFFSKIFLEPFKIFAKITQWFFQAKYTGFLIIFLFAIFIIQILFINQSETLLQSLMSHPNNLANGNYWGVFTSLFLHANISHLLSNLLALLVFGRIVEKHFGFNVITAFISSGIIANIVSNYIWLYLGDIAYSLGASSGVAGLIILAILLEPFAITSVFIVPLPIFLVGWFLIALDLIGLSNPSQTNHLAHLSGYSTLLILFFFLEFRNRKKIKYGLLINLGFLLLGYLVINLIGINFFKKII